MRGDYIYIHTRININIKIDLNVNINMEMNVLISQSKDMFRDFSSFTDLHSLYLVAASRLVWLKKKKMEQAGILLLHLHFLYYSL